MSGIEHKLLIVQLVNRLLDPVLAPILALFGMHARTDGELIPDFLAMSLLIVIFFAVFGLLFRSRLSVDNPSRFQIVMEDIIGGLVGLLDEWIGPKGRQFLPLVGALGGFILVGNYAGLIPGLMAPTSSMNVTAGCAITIWVYYHFHGIRAQGLGAYLKHFAMPPGMPVFLAPLMIVIEPISHLSRVLSLTLRLFGNIFGEEMVIAVLAMIVPYYLFWVPLPMMALALITGALQAFIFVLLSIIYLQGAVGVEHHEDAPGHAHDATQGELAAA